MRGEDTLPCLQWCCERILISRGLYGDVQALTHRVSWWPPTGSPKCQCLRATRIKPPLELCQTPSKRTTTTTCNKTWWCIEQSLFIKQKHNILSFDIKFVVRSSLPRVWFPYVIFMFTNPWYELHKILALFNSYIDNNIIDLVSFTKLPPWVPIIMQNFNKL